MTPNAATPRVKILTLSSLYPNSAQPYNGVFIEQRIRHLMSSGQVDLRVVAPVPWFPAAVRTRSPKYAAFAKAPRTDTRFDIEVRYPRHPVIPKIGMSVAPILLATSLLLPLRNLIREGYRFDVIDAYYFYPIGVAAAILGKLFDKPVIITALGSDLNIIPQFSLPRRMIRWAARNAARITTVSDALKQQVCDLGVAGETVRVIRHGVDHGFFKAPEDRSATRARLGISRPTLLSVGNLIELKGHHLAIEALRELPDVELLIAGQGEDEGRLRRLAASLGVADRTRFLGFLNHAELRDYYGAADALVLASSSEGIANVLLESMSCGTPVIATRVGGSPEVVGAPEAGILMRERTVGALVESTRQLLGAYPDRAATRAFSMHFTWEQTTEQHLDLVREVVSRHDKQHAVRAEA